MDLLREIMAERRQDAAEARSRVPREVLERQAHGRAHRSLSARLRAGGGARIIAEVKKASPSAGLLREAYQPGEMAKAFERAGAVGISVLTEPRRFMGSEAHLRDVRQAVELPVLRKDFLGDAYQVWEAAAWGADVVLLIVAGLDRAALELLYGTALECGLEVLAEAHTEAEVDAALSLDQAIVGVNSRDLRTLKTDLAVTRRLASRIPRERLSVAESGVRRREDIESLAKLGYDGFLIGEALMAHGDPAAKLAELL